jgi:hypothetical protein
MRSFWIVAVSLTALTTSTASAQGSIRTRSSKSKRFMTPSTTRAIHRSSVLKSDPQRNPIRYQTLAPAAASVRVELIR